MRNHAGPFWLWSNLDPDYAYLLDILNIINNDWPKLIVHPGITVDTIGAFILNKDGFCDMMGIPKDDVGFLHIDSPFEKKNRPIFFFPTGKMTKKEIDGSLPKLASSVSKIIDNHSKEGQELIYP